MGVTRYFVKASRITIILLIFSVYCIGFTGCMSIPNEPPGNFNSSRPSVGIVFLHAKWREPHSAKVAPLIDDMWTAGIWVVQPEMPWSRNRNYNAGYGDAILEIHKAVENMHDNNVDIVFVAGHSFGANAAIGYAARYTDIAGVIA